MDIQEDEVETLYGEAEKSILEVALHQRKNAGSSP